MEELLYILNKLKENTHTILEKNKKLEDEIETLKKESNNGKYINCFNIGIYLNGIETVDNTRLSTDYISVNITDNKIKIVNTSDYYYTLRLYDSDKNYLGFVPGSSFKKPTLGWGEGTEIIISDVLTSEVTYIKLLMKCKESNENINSVSGTICIDDEFEYILKYMG